jgi:hypothetical protein
MTRQASVLNIATSVDLCSFKFRLCPEILESVLDFGFRIAVIFHINVWNFTHHIGVLPHYSPCSSEFEV